MTKKAAKKSNNTSRRKPRLDASQTALRIVEAVIGGKLTDKSTNRKSRKQ